MERRDLLKTFSIGAAAVIFPGLGANPVRGEENTLVMANAALSPSPKALVFDTFGTVVDWRTSIIEEGTACGKARGLKVDWARFADQWRSRYSPSLDKVRRGELPWTKLDVLHRMILEDLLREFRIDGLTEEEKDHWNRVWHRLKPWPDSVAGLARLKKKFVIAPLSNGNVALLTNMAKHAGLPWDAILSAELAKRYKPAREVYLMAADLLGADQAAGVRRPRAGRSRTRHQPAQGTDQ